MRLSATLYPVEKPKPIEVTARTKRGLLRKVQRELAHGCVLEPRDLRDAGRIVRMLGFPVHGAVLENPKPPGGPTYAQQMKHHEYLHHLKCLEAARVMDGPS